MIRLGRGKWKGHILRPSLQGCRPTSGLVRGAVFDIAGEITASASTVWDLCCGTGAVGIEALSIGASSAVFVDRQRAPRELIASFLDEREALDAARIITGDVRRIVPLKGESPDLVFIDPPYSELYLYNWIWSLDWGSIVAPGGLVFVESGGDPGLAGWTTRGYGDSWLSWMKGPR